MKKEIKFNTLSVKNDKLEIENAIVDIPFFPPNLQSITPLRHISVTLHLSDGSDFQKLFDYLPECPVDSYIKVAVAIFNQYQNDSIDKAK